MDGIKEYSDKISDEDIIKDAYELWEEISEFESEQRDLMQEDLEFSIGNFWDPIVEQERKLDGRPCLNIPRINEFINSVSNQMREAKPSIKTVPHGSDNRELERVRVKKTERRQGLIRSIQNSSNAIDAYQAAFDTAVITGRSFIRLRTDYVNEQTFDQTIIIENIPHPLDVYVDRNCHTTYDYREMKHCFILKNIPKKQFQAKYPDASPIHWSDESDSKWVNSDDVTVAEFYCTWTKKRELFILEDGTKGYMDELTELSKETQDEIKMHIVNKREVHQPYIMWYKMTSQEILDRKEVIGKYIPIVPFIVVERVIKGKYYVKGIVRDMRDLQMLYNYASSNQAERLALSPRVPFIAAEGQIEGYEKDWANANSSRLPVLPYKPVSSGGQLVPAPQRQMPIQQDPGITQQKMEIMDDMRAVTGIHQPSLGMTSNNARSGIAIKSLQSAGEQSTMHYVDNARIAITQIGRIVNSWLSSIYDTNRIVRILGDQGDPKNIELGARDEDGDLIELGNSNYDIEIMMTQDYKTKRQEGLDFMMTLIQQAPNIAPTIMDLVAGSIDSPMSQEVADRLRKLVPADVLDDKGGERQVQLQLQKSIAQLQQNKELIKMLVNQLEQAKQIIMEKQIDYKKAIELEYIKNQGKISVANINALSDANKEATKATMHWSKVFSDELQKTNDQDAKVQMTKAQMSQQALQNQQEEMEPEQEQQEPENMQPPVENQNM